MGLPRGGGDGRGQIPLSQVELAVRGGHARRVAQNDPRHRSSTSRSGGGPCRPGGYATASEAPSRTFTATARSIAVDGCEATGGLSVGAPLGHLQLGRAQAGQDRCNEAASDADGDAVEVEGDQLLPGP